MASTASALNLFADASEKARALFRGSRRETSGIKEFVRLFALQFVSYFAATWNFRVIAQAHYVSIAVSDAGLAAIQFTLIQRVAKTDNNLARAGYVLGGVSGSLLATFLTQVVYGA